MGAPTLPPFWSAQLTLYATLRSAQMAQSLLFFQNAVRIHGTCEDVISFTSTWKARPALCWISWNSELRNGLYENLLHRISLYVTVNVACGGSNGITRSSTVVNITESIFTKLTFPELLLRNRAAIFMKIWHNAVAASRLQTDGQTWSAHRVFRGFYFWKGD
jgi:hypothetical protein